ncbi:MAG: TraR/DksA C4-type zinc finger protein [Caldilineaceae bacterium]
MLAILELETIQQQLQAKRDQLLADLEENSNDNSGPNANPDRTALAQAYHSKDRQLALRTMHQQTLGQIERALAQIEQGTYGLCVQCHQPIHAERLEALPYATLCITCQAESSHKG